MTKTTSLLVMSLLLLLFPVLVSAQTTSNTSAVTGTVTDNTGAIIPGASVKLIDTKTSKELETTANDQGVYRFNQVAPGDGYSLVFANPGFQTLTITEVRLGVGQTETHNATLTAGQITEQVTVTSGGEATLNTTDASIGNVIEERRLRELPIQIRNSPAALIGLQPGVVGNNLGTATANRVGSVTGSRADQGNITVDGIDANDQATGQFASTVGNAPIDSIQEFRTVSTNPNAAEGRSSGGQVELITKSGTNDFHGNARWYNRTSATAANNFFNNSAGVFGPNETAVLQGRAVAGAPRVPRPKLIRNQFGGSIGGPIVKDKLFFFFDFEGRKDIQEVSYLRIVPTNNFRAGQIGYINNGAGCSAASRQNTQPGCISFLTAAQAAALDPLGIGPNAAFLSFINGRYPTVNDPTAGNGVNTGGFRFNAPSNRTDKTFVTRIDWNATDRQKLFGRFNIARRQQTDTVNTVAAQFPGDPEAGQIVVRDYSWVVGHTWTVNANIVNQLTVGVSRSGLLFPNDHEPTFPNEYGASSATGGTFGGTNLGLSTPFPDFSDQDRFVQTPTIRDDLTWTMGSHTIAFGGSFKPIKSVSGLVNDFNFISIGLGGNLSGLDAAQRPANILAGTSPTSTYDSAFAFLLGRFGSVSTNFVYDVNGVASAPGSGKTRDFRYNEYELYFQDNWKARNDLTLTAGVRWQYYPAPYEADGFQACNDIDFRQLTSIRFRNAGQGLIGFDQSLAAEPLTRYDLCGRANNARAYYEPDLNNFAPRLSFAWNPSFKDGILGSILGDRKTVIRGGGSVQYDRTAGALTFIQDQLSYLFDNSKATNFGSLATSPRFTAINVLPVINTPPSVTRPVTPFVDAGFPFGNAEGQFNYAIDQQFKTPYSLQYSFGFQRELPGNFLLEMSYVGRQGRQLFSQADAGQILDYRDPASGQTLLAAFNAVQAQIIAGVASANLTPQPFIENQLSNAIPNFYGLGQTCGTVGNALLGIPVASSCTRLFAGIASRNLIAIGDVSDSFQALYAFGLVNPNVGLPAQFSSNVFITNLASSTYNGMLVSLRRRFSNGLQFDVNYTWSHAIDNQSSIANTVVGGLICDLRNLRVCRGNSDFDIRHLFNANWIYELPFGRGRSFMSDSGGVVDAIVGGWSFTGIFVARSGLPFSTTTGSFPVGFSFNSPAVIDGDATALEGQVNVNPTSGAIQFFPNVATARAQLRNPIGGEIGARNTFRGPGFWNVDLAILKNFRLPWSENHRLQLRAEMYNAFNHTNFGLPNANFASGAFGNITATANAAREMQFAIRYEF